MQRSEPILTKTWQSSAHYSFVLDLKSIAAIRNDITKGRDVENPTKIVDFSTSWKIYGRDQSNILRVIF